MEQPLTLPAQLIKAEALRLGFHRCGMAPAGPVPDGLRAGYEAWLRRGGQAEMHYLERHADLRSDPRRLLEGARTVVSVALNYYPARSFAPGALHPAWYAYGRDYHDVVRERLTALLRTLQEAVGRREGRPAPEGRVCCDTAPVAERYWAQRCGVGWTGRHGQLIVPGAGSTFFLGELLLTADVDAYDTPAEGRCGNCRRCLDACPGGALRGDGTLDARRCLSYLTIEHRGPLPPRAARHMGRCFYGCDRCQEACPHLRGATPTDVPDFRPSAELLAMTETDWAALDPEAYRRLFKGSAMKRAKFEGLRRNLDAVLRSRPESEAPPPGNPPDGGQDA